jgi:hypothetical protein
MPVTPDKVFIYGRFEPNERSLPMPGAIGSPILPLSAAPDVAVEILREFSATELVGKVYVKGKSGNWVPSSQGGIRSYSWYQDFPRLGLIFITEGSSPWGVLYFRQESDESGPYVAVGLRLQPPENTSWRPLT